MPKFQEQAHIKFAILFVIIIPSPAFAYFDPGTGSLIVQGLIAVLLGGLFWIKTRWKKFIFFINELKKYFDIKI
jgi:hypothetical protein